MGSTPSGALSASTLPNMKKCENKVCYVFCHQANHLKLWLTRLDPMTILLAATFEEINGLFSVSD